MRVDTEENWLPQRLKPKPRDHERFYYSLFFLAVSVACFGLLTSKRSVEVKTEPR